MREFSIFSLCLLISLLVFTGCGDDEPKTETPPPHPGKALAETYCQSCHKLPSPSLLDEKTWHDHILVRMGAFLGIYYDNIQYYETVPPQWIEPGEGGRRVTEANIYPKQPALSREEFEQIRDYYLKSAPKTTPPALIPWEVSTELTQFKPRPLLAGGELAAAVTGVAIQEETGELYAGFAKQSLIKLDPTGKVLDQIPGGEAPVQISFRHGRLDYADIGNIRGADNPIGIFRSASSWDNLKNGRYEVELEGLQRPVHTSWADLDQDGDEDLLICEFGYLLGSLAWYENQEGKFEKRILYPDDGAGMAWVHDFNEDSLPDIAALMANSDEGIDIWLNQGDGKFKQNRIFRFDPSYGSTCLKLVDWNEDGKMDLLYANGDNGDYPAILKNYHGIRLYLNKGDLKFEEAFFLRMDGAYWVTPQDFDLDGDLDLAAVSFYPNYEEPRGAFIYYENDGKDQFTPYTFPGFDQARWMVMDVGDIEKDGDADILLGAFNVKSSEVPTAIEEKWTQNNTPLMLLENQAK